MYEILFDIIIRSNNFTQGSQIRVTFTSFFAGHGVGHVDVIDMLVQSEHLCNSLSSIGNPEKYSNETLDKLDEKNMTYILLIF